VAAGRSSVGLLCVCVFGFVCVCPAARRPAAIFGAVMVAVQMRKERARRRRRATDGRADGRTAAAGVGCRHTSGSSDFELTIFVRSKRNGQLRRRGG
jgi:hypothetical protein